jgi:hypothetical protein
MTMRNKNKKTPGWKLAVAILLSVLLVPQTAMFAGGPLAVGGPSFGISGAAFVWDSAAPIRYRVDGGPLSQSPGGGSIVIDNAAGVARVDLLFGNWAAVRTASLSFSNLGGILPVGSFTGGDVKTAQDFLSVEGDFSGQSAPDPASCIGGGQSPIMFDADGSIFQALGLPPGVIGFAFECDVNPTTGKIVSAGAILNGKFQDGINTSGNYELTSAEFDEAFTHEFGHFLGLGHSQINVEVLEKLIAGQQNACNNFEAAGMPLMFPLLGICPAKTSIGLPILAPDDAAWISKLYPQPTTTSSGKQSFASAYGTLSGTVYFSDGITPAQGVNIIARNVISPTLNAVSAVSGYEFTGNPGQTVTCQDPKNPTPQTCSNLGYITGSRDPSLIGHFEMPLPPGTWTLSVESVFPDFTGGSSLTPLDPPIPIPGTYNSSAPISVTAGGQTIFNITLQGTPQRFDSFESAKLIMRDALWLWQRRQELLVQAVDR